MGSVRTSIGRVVRRLLGGGRDAGRASGTPVDQKSEWLRPADLKELLCCETPTILEIGANDGEHTCWFLDAFEKPRIYCFEPEPRAIARFKSKVGDRPNVRLHEIAVGETDGDALFFRSDGVAEDPNFPRPESGWDYSGSLKSPKGHLAKYPWVKFENTIVVRRRALDSWAAENGVEAVDLLWMDVQGAERDVIRGASATLAKTRYVFTEYSEDELYEGQVGLAEILRLLPQFRVVRCFSEDVLLQNVRLVENSAGEERRR